MANKDLSNLFNDFDDLYTSKSNINNVNIPDNQLLLPSGKIITFNAEQYDGIKKIRKWLKSDKTFLTLIGPAGCGKSTIIKNILDEYRGGVVVSAPTHRAKKVIINTTGEEGKTLASLLGLRPDVLLENFDPNRPQFAPIATPQLCDYNWVIIDEASQINDPLYLLIKEKAKECRVKILFMGDIFQIPPVGQKQSMVFSDPDIEIVELTIIERQQDSNPLLSLYDIIRNNIETQGGGYLRKNSVNENGEGVVFTVDKKEFREKMLETYRSEDFQKDINHVKTIAWKNDTVMASNKIIRTALFGKDTDIVEENDLLTGYRTVSNAKLTYNIVENSADYRIVKKSSLEENGYGIKGFQIKIKEELGRGLFKFDDVFIVDSGDYENLHTYGQMHDFFRDMAKSNHKMWPKYYEFRRNNLLLCDIDKHQNGLLRNDNEIIKKDLDYGYACTAHKIQGGTLNTCFVLESDIRLNWNQQEQNQIFYVAVSRPTKIAYVLTTKLD